MANQAPANTITIPSLRGGLDDNDPPAILPDDACTIAQNVEFFYSTIGERRMGCSVLTDLPTAFSMDPGIAAVTWMGRHLPTNNLADAEMWALGQSLTTNYSTLMRRDKSSWQLVTPVDPIISFTDGSALSGHRLFGTPLHGKFYLAYNSGIDLQHVWDGTTLRQTGLAAAPAVTTVVDFGSGTFTGIRYYRVRFTVQSGATVLLRSEPGTAFSFTPSGTGSETELTQPSPVPAGVTNWEIEASTDGAFFFRVATLPITTTVYFDTVPFSLGYLNAGGITSEPLTSYTRIPSGKYLSADSDRLLIAGSWQNPAYSSRVWWTPTLANTGVGNDERLDMTVNPYIDLDGYQGGEITGLSKPVNGYLYAFKWSQIYKIIRTGQLTNAYSAILLTTARGALPGTLVEAVDQTGAPAQYFLDPLVGPMRIGQYGVEWCGRDLRATWKRVNLSATVPAFGVFYQHKNQVHFWVALDGADHPNSKIIVQCNEMRSFSIQSYGTTLEGARRGWSTVPVGDRIADAHCALMFDDNVSDVGPRSYELLPYIGKERWTVLGSTITQLIQQCDVGTTDCFVSGDIATYYKGVVQTKPFIPTGLLQKHGTMSGMLMATAVVAPQNGVYVQPVVNFGLLTKQAVVDLSPDVNEAIVIRKLDNLSIAQCITLQFQFGDLDPDVQPATSWQLHVYSTKIRAEETQ